MRFLGVTLIVIAVLSVLFPFFGAGFQFMQWADQWGESTGFGIKAGIAFVGFLLARFAPKRR
jgi:hypothetical protein